jgi:membrane protein YqaA with SNARE-associated domain
MARRSVEPIMGTSAIAAPHPVAAAARTHHSLIPHWLTHLGGLGLFSLAVLDSSVIPVPLPGSTDLLLLWLVSHHGEPWLLAGYATAGSILGGYTNWSSGKRGGKAALQRYARAPRLQRVSHWVEHHSILAVFLPALLPPPTPMSVFLLAAGALGMSRKHFLLAFGTARLLRYGLIAWLAMVYGRRVVRLWSGTLEKWSAPLLWTFVTIVVSGVCYGLWQIRQERLHPREIDLPMTQSIE